MKENQQARIRTAALGGVAAALIAALLYALTLSRHYTADSLLYALAIEGDNSRALIDPTHLLLHPLALLWFRVWQAVGWTGRSLVPLQILNAMAGALSVGLLWSLARALSRSSRAATIIALGFAFSGGLWLLSVEAEFVTVPLALQLLALWSILGIAPEYIDRSWYAVSLGLVVALAIFAYLTSVFLILVVLVGLLTANLNQRRRWRQIALFLATVLLILIPVFGFSLSAWSGGDLNRFKSLGGQGAYGLLNWLSIPHGLYAFLRSIGLFPGLVMNDSTQDMLAAAGNETRLIFFAYYGLVAFLGLLPVVCLILRRRTTSPGIVYLDDDFCCFRLLLGTRRCYILGTCFGSMVADHCHLLVCRQQSPLLERRFVSCIVIRHR